MRKLEDRLIDKSKEAFSIAIELYNKPTIKYRVEGFSMFICNAWELMLNDKDPLRLNLEKIIELRNTSTHFITEEYEMVYVPLFQACVL